MITVNVELGERAYPIHIGADLIGKSELFAPHIRGASVTIVTNTTVDPLYGETLRKALYGSNPQAVALACRAAGIDRSVFTTVFRLSRLHRRVTAELSPSDQKQIGAIFTQIKKTEALDRLKTAQA